METATAACGLLIDDRGEGDFNVPATPTRATQKSVEVPAMKNLIFINMYFGFLHPNKLPI